MDSRQDDLDLLTRYADTGDPAAFAELVRRHIHWVNSMAVRLVHDTALAEDVSQSVFILLARRAKSLHRQTILAPWLFTVTRYCAKDALRSELRRRKNEALAAAMTIQITSQPDVEWQQLAPLLDGLVNRLRSGDRDVVLLRFYQDKSFPEIGELLDISEEAARKRVLRAIEKLRDLFARKGVTVGAAALTAALGANTTHTASAALTASATNAAVTAASGGGLAGSTSLLVDRVAVLLWWMGKLKPMNLALVATIVCVIAFASGLQIPALRHSSIQNPNATTPGEPNGAYLGRVVTSDGKPVAGALVFPVSDYFIPGYSDFGIPRDSIRTDSQGLFQFDRTPRRTSALVQTPDGRIAGAKLPLNPEMRREIVLHAPASLILRLVDSVGDPVSGVRVRPCLVADNRHAWSITLPPEISRQMTQMTDSNGFCRIENLPRNSLVRVSIDDDRFADIIYWRDPPFAIGSSAMVNGGEIKLEPAGSISGRVTLAHDNSPVAGVMVEASTRPISGALRNEISSKLKIAQTDANGYYHFSQLPLNTYGVYISPSDPRFPMPPRSPLVRVVENHRVTGIDLTLTPGSLIRGRVVSQSSGQPVAGVTVIAKYAKTTNFSFGPPGERNQAKSDEQGRYTLHVRPGRFSIDVFGAPADMVMPEWRLLPAVLRNSIVASEGEEMTLPDIALLERKEKEVVTRLTRGRVVDEDGYPVSGAEVFFADKQLLQGWPAPGTMFETNDKGEYAIEIGEPGQQLYARLGHLTNVLDEPPPDDAPATLTLRKNLMTSLGIRVTNEAHEPIVDARITIKAEGRIERAMLVSNMDGYCVCDRLEPDWYTITVIANGYASVPDRHVIELEPGRQGEQVIQMRKATGVVAGVVIDKDGRPQSGIIVSLSSGKEVQRVVTNEAGRFRFWNLVENTTTSLTVGAGAGVPKQSVTVGSADLKVVYALPLVTER